MHNILNNSLRFDSINFNQFTNFINKKGSKPEFLNQFEIETQFKSGNFGNEYTVILKLKTNSEIQFFKIVGFYSSFYGVSFDESSNFVEVKPKLVTVTKFESIERRKNQNAV